MPAAAKAQNYEARPPHCGNCDHFKKVPVRKLYPNAKQLAGFVSICGLGDFTVQRHAICDRWKQGGQELEA